jgi:class 3 adenylate cyclase
VNTLSPYALTPERIEQLAARVHAAWVRQREAEGWRLGPNRDDEKLLHPCLVPYEQLSEAEKEVDRATVRAVLAALQEDDPECGERAVSWKRGEVPLEQIRRADRGRLLDLWHAGSRDQGGKFPPQWISALAARALKIGECWLALDFLREVDFSESVDRKLVYLQAMALAQMGNTGAARRVLEPLLRSESAVSDDFCLMGRTFKEEFLRGGGEDFGLAREAMGWYRMAFDKFASSAPGAATFPAINVASLALLSDDEAEAKRWAHQVLELVPEALADPNQAPWTPPTVGEAHLVLGDFEQARTHYLQCERLGLREQASARRQARLLLHHQGQSPDLLDSCFDLPGVVVFAGHLPDPPERATPRFPPGIENTLRQVLDDELAACRAGIGFASAAAGSDILFAEALLARRVGGKAVELHIHLPGPKEDFVQRSVAPAGRDWVSRFQNVVAASVHPVDRGDLHQPGDQSLAYVFATRKLCGLALMKARSLHLDLTALAVCDPSSSDSGGGTASFVRFWEERGGPAPSRQYLPQDQIYLGHRTINPLAFLPGGKAGEVSLRTVSATWNATVSSFRVGQMQQEIKALLFADVRGFSNLSESQLPGFMHSYMRMVSRLVDEHPARPIIVESWGDALYMIFDDVIQAGEFTLGLRRALSPPPSGDFDGASRGLPPDLAIRIALHAGPVFSLADPVTRRITFTGRHVSQAARLEPITAAGEIYCTDSFAALAATEVGAPFECEYIGHREMAKKYSIIPVYRLHERVRRTE